MKICIDCGRQLFDRDNSCDKCNSKNIISEEEYNEIVEELKHTNIFTKRKLLQNRNYKCIYDRLQQPEISYPKPKILENNNSEECDEEYWKRVNQHTINNNTLVSQIIECPYCHSKDTKKISTTSRVISTSLFGLGSKKIGKQYHCNKCNSDF